MAEENRKGVFGRDWKNTQKDTEFNQSQGLEPPHKQLHPHLHPQKGKKKNQSENDRLDSNLLNI